MTTPTPSLFAEDVSRELVRELDAKNQLALSGVTSQTAKAFVLAGLLQSMRLPTVWICDDDDAVVRVAQDLRLFGVQHLAAFTSETGPDPEVAYRRAAVAFARIHAGQGVVIVAAQEFLDKLPLVSTRELENHRITLAIGQRLDLTGLFSKLIDMGYQVSESAILPPGTYIRRGGVIDVFPTNREEPLRIELWGDEVETMQRFDPANQRILGDLSTTDIYPLTTGGEPANLPRYLQQALVIHDELPTPAPKGQRTIVFQPLVDEAERASDRTLDFSAVLRFHTPIDFAADLRQRIESEEQWRAIIVTSDEEKVWNLLVDQGLTDQDLLHVSLLQPVASTGDVFGEAGEINPSRRTQLATFPEAFQSRMLKLLLLTEREIFGTFTGERRSTPSSAAAETAFLATLAPGDLVVHIDYGVAIFRGVERKTVAGTTREYLFLEYAQGDKLFAPIDQADKVNKYIGATGDNAPALTRLGSSDWSTVTHRARKETLEVAKELLELYAIREASQGFTYPPDDDAVRQFEHDFPYVETPGQIRTLHEVKADMERVRPMDRLVCGDVGFGKTEIGMRAAFKAVRAGKQVAYLAPITILVAQQFEAFKKRMAGFDVRIEMLSRFVSPAQQKRVLADMAQGKIDIVVGTHRLLEEDVVFKDLGLLIIDEEQRFGVRQKERLKKLRAMVDILTLTATPVPRTLNMALSGLRDISTITTPPPGRLPIATEVRRFSLTFIRDVILRELERKGQIYFLHNRVQTIESTAEKLRELIPEARFIVAHGQLAPHELEDRIIAFKEHRFDVLVSSTIIENGIDLPNANTLIVDRAERLGLAQAYQLRGRVGRSKTQAYAYFLYHSQKLDDTAKKRLRAIVEASELGSGFQIAMRDLEIRGAGDILGDKQHGTISAIGVTHFTRLLKSAVESLKSGAKQEELLERPPTETAIELNVTAFIPESYIEREGEKLKMYQRLAGANSDAALAEVTRDLQEAYGPPPPETQNLLHVLALKLAAAAAGVSSVKESRSGRDEFLELVLTKEVTPAAVMNLLAFESRWLVTGTSLKIPKEVLGDGWFAKLREHVVKLLVHDEPKPVRVKKAVVAKPIDGAAA